MRHVDSFSIRGAGVRSVAIILSAGFMAGTAAAASLLTSHVPPAVASHAAPLVGIPDSSRVLHVAIVLPMRNLAALGGLLEEIYDPSGPQFRHYLSVSEFTDRFGPTESDYAKSLQFFEASGLTITGTAANRYLIDAAGSVETLERVLHVKFGLYQHPTENRVFIAPDSEPSVDMDVALLKIVGLDDATPPVPRVYHATSITAGAGGSGPGGQFLGKNMRAAYYGGGTLTGAKQSLGLMELGPYNPNDVNSYFKKFGPPLTTAVVPISTDGSTPTCTRKCGNDSEQALDIEYAIAMAPGLAQVQVYVANSPESVLNRMASDNTSAQLSTSWGWNPAIATDDPLFMEMAAQGQTLLTASGDYSSLAASGPWPEESAYITGVGGTDLKTTHPNGPWAGESGWSGSAGGPSIDGVAIPSYQRSFINAANKGSMKLRNVPDIAANANTNMYICADNTCSGGNGGTSFASPIWAGFIALANEQAAAQSLPRIGFLNPIVYRLGGRTNYDVLFHDTIGGMSGKYTAVQGYDLVTGFGSPQHGNALIDALLVPPPAP